MLWGIYCRMAKREKETLLLQKASGDLFHELIRKYNLRSDGVVGHSEEPIFCRFFDHEFWHRLQARLGEAEFREDEFTDAWEEIKKIGLSGLIAGLDVGNATARSRAESVLKKVYPEVIELYRQECRIPVDYSIPSAVGHGSTQLDAFKSRAYSVGTIAKEY